MEADLIIHNAKIYTVDETWSVAEAMAIKDGKILAIGPEREVMNKYQSAEKLDAEKRPVYPGFIDAHCHFLWQGRMLNEVNLVGTKSVDEIAERLKEAEPNRGEWITGRGWDQNDWDKKTYPNHEVLDSLFPDTPVYLVRIDGHAAWVNQTALELAGINGPQEVSGGKILIENGKPTGVLIDRAMELIKAHIPDENEDELSKYIREAEALCFKHGITSLADAGLPVKTVRTMMKLDENGEIRMNIHQMIEPGEDAEAWMREGHHSSEHITVRSFKMYADGALGSRGASLLEPYSDDTTNTGIVLNAMDEYNHWAGICHETDYQLCMHAIGDGANRMVLDLYSNHLEKNNDRRWRVEHAQIVHPGDVPKFGEYNIIPSVQPTHATSDSPWAEERLGPDRLQHAYAFEDLKNQLGLIALGTDFPIEHVNPLATFFSAVFRKPLGEKKTSAFLPENALSREDALRGMTIWAAISNFQENERGSLKEGKAADIVILNRDILTTPESEFQNIEVMNTFVDGEKVYEAY